MDVETVSAAAGQLSDISGSGGIGSVVDIVSDLGAFGFHVIRIRALNRGADQSGYRQA